MADTLIFSRAEKRIDGVKCPVRQNDFVKMFDGFPHWKQTRDNQ